MNTLITWKSIKQLSDTTLIQKMRSEIVESHDALKLLTQSLVTHQENIKTLEHCLSAIRSLAVRNEYCQEVVDEGGLGHVHTLLVNFPQVTFLHQTMMY